MKSLSQKIWCYRLWLLRSRSTVSAGFTLIELLVTLIIGSIVTTGLLYLVTELLQVERRETAVNQVQQDVQRALDFMATDLQEAVHVYSTPSVIADQLNGFAGPSTSTVLAFWRVDPIDDNDVVDCTGYGSTTAIFKECSVLEVRRSYYTLVLYQLIENTPSTNPNGTWDGRARIVRYKFPKYTNVSTLASTPGYREPIDPDPTDGFILTFENWTPASPGSVTGETLVDYVDSAVPDVAVDASLLNCPSGQVRSPSASAVTPANWTSFFACIRDSGLAAGNDPGNQDVEIFLRGNVQSGNAGLIRPLSVGSGLPTLRKGIQVRGVVQKSPGS